MKRLATYTLLFFLACLFLCRCIILKERWSDKKAAKVFGSKAVPLALYDTTINGHPLHYAISGSDSLPTLVFIHGSPGSWFHYMKFMWDSAMRQKYRIVSIDRPGFGYSGFGNAMHLQEQSRLLVPLLARLKSKKPMIGCGHSYGGPLVAQIAADVPDLFQTIVIVAGALDLAQEKTETWRKVMSYQPLSWFLPGAFQPSNTELLYLKKDLEPLANDLGKITTNVVFVHGDKDTWVPIANVGFGKTKMIHAASIKIDTLVGADHQVPWKRRDELRDILLALP